MNQYKKEFYTKRADLLIRHLKNRHFDAYFCATKEEACMKAVELIPEGSSVGWGGATTAEEIGLKNAIRSGNFQVIDRDKATNPEEKENAERACLCADYFITGANAISLDGEMVNIDGIGNRVASIIYGPRNVLVVAGMNKVMDNLDEAMKRARNVAAPNNRQRFGEGTPCYLSGKCEDCHSTLSICNQIVITRNCRPAGRIKFILVGEDLGF